MRNGVSFWKDVLRPIVFGMGNGYSPATVKHDVKFTWTIYGDSLNVRDHVKAFNWFHGVWKARIIYPALALLKWLQSPRKRFRKSIRPHRAHDALLAAFDASFEEALELWIRNYAYSGNCTEEQLKHRLHSSKANMLRKLKEIVLGVALNDDAYRELLCAVMLTIARRVGELGHDGVYCHVPYKPPYKEINFIHYVYMNEAVIRAMQTGQDVTFRLPKNAFDVVEEDYRK